MAFIARDFLPAQYFNIFFQRKRLQPDRFARARRPILFANNPRAFR
jgi:hypothetical protein